MNVPWLARLNYELVTKWEYHEETSCFHAATCKTCDEFNIKMLENTYSLLAELEELKRKALLD